MAGDNWGIVRAGQADGLIGIFDNGVTTFQFLPTGNFNGGDSQSFMPGNVPPTWIWLSQAGGEYDNTKVVYMSPQIAGGADLCRVHGGWQHYWRGTMASCHSSRRWCSDAGLPAGCKLRERAVDSGEIMRSSIAVPRARGGDHHVVKHSSASGGQSSSEPTMTGAATIAGDGRGFDLGSGADRQELGVRHLGLIGVRERLALFARNA